MISAGSTLESSRALELYRNLVSAVFELGSQLRPLSPTEVGGLFDDDEKLPFEELSAIHFELVELLSYAELKDAGIERFSQALASLVWQVPDPLRWTIWIACMDAAVPAALLTHQTIDFDDFRPALSSSALKGIVPLYCSLALGRERIELVSNWLTYTEDLAGHLSEQVALGPGASLKIGSMRCSPERAAEIGTTRELLATVSRGEFDEALILGRLVQHPKETRRLLRDLFLDKGSELDLEHWACFMQEAGFEEAMSYNFSSLLYALRDRRLMLTTLLRQMLLHEIRSEGGRGKLLSWALEYALDLDDIELFPDLYQIFWVTNEAQKPVSLDLIIKGAFRFGLQEELCEDLVNRRLLTFADFRNISLLRSLAKENSAIEKILDSQIRALSRTPEQISDLGTCLIAILHCSENDSECEQRLSKRVGELVGAQAQEYQRRFSHIRRYRLEFTTLAYSTALNNSHFYQGWRRSKASKTPFLQPIFSFLDSVTNLDGGKADFSSSNFLAHGVEALALVHAWSSSSLAEEEAWQCTAVELMKRIDESGRVLPPELVAKALRIVWASPSSLEVRGGRIRQILSLENSNLDNAASAALMVLVRSDKTRAGISDFREIAKSCGIAINAISQAQIVSLDIARGDFDSREFIKGPDSGTWQSLSIILDDVIHEVNQPIASLGNSLVELKFRLAKAGYETAASPAISRLETSLEILASRIDEYRALSQEFGAPRVIKLADLVHQVSTELSVFAADRDVSLEVLDYKVKRAPYVFGESFKLRLAIRNLVRNAVQAAESSHVKKVTLNLFNPSGSSDTIVLQVTDSGSGIPESLKDSIFQKGITTKPGRGLGLGLSLTATVIKEIGGRIALEDTGPSGTTFVLQLEVFDATDTYGNLRPTDRGREK